ncbi:MAG TPA: hypothetical protein VND21_06670, partial [Planctomycetota bacterium]|nr:hypothetical protein [Planctomycetota bacterium]
PQDVAPTRTDAFPEAVSAPAEPPRARAPEPVAPRHVPVAPPPPPPRPPTPPPPPPPPARADKPFGAGLE